MKSQTISRIGTDVRVAATLAFASLFVPTFAFAGQFGQIDTFAVTIVEFINGTLIPLIFAFGLLMFIWGVFKYLILGGANEETREQGKQLVLYSILGFVMMIIIFALVNLLAGGILEGLDMPNDGIINTPRVEI